MIRLRRGPEPTFEKAEWEQLQRAGYGSLEVLWKAVAAEGPGAVAKKTAIPPARLERVLIEVAIAEDEPGAMQRNTLARCIGAAAVASLALTALLFLMFGRPARSSVPLPAFHVIEESDVTGRGTVAMVGRYTLAAVPAGAALGPHHVSARPLAPSAQRIVRGGYLLPLVVERVEPHRVREGGFAELAVIPDGDGAQSDVLWISPVVVLHLEGRGENGGFAIVALNDSSLVPLLRGLEQGAALLGHASG